MKYKLLTIPLMALLMVSFAFALVQTTSIRAESGKVNWLGGYTSFDSVKIKFSSWSRQSISERNGPQGQSSLQLQAVTTQGKKVILNLHFDQTDVIEDSDTRLYVNSEAHGTYYNGAVLLPFSRLKQVNIATVRYDYNKLNGIVNIAGEGDVSFRITGMLVTFVK